MEITGFGCDYPAEPTKFVKFPGWDSPVPNSGISTDGYYIGGPLAGKVFRFDSKKRAQAAAVAVGFGKSDVTKVHTRFFTGWAICDGRFGLVSAEWYKAHPNHLRLLGE